MYTLNQTVKVFNDIADAHKQINFFDYGLLENIASSGTINYPYLYLALRPAQKRGKSILLNFTVVLSDLSHKTQVSSQDVESDLLEVCNDIASLLQDPNYPFKLITDNIRMEPFRDRFEDEVTGWLMDLSIEIPVDLDRCAVPGQALINSNPRCPDVQILDSAGALIANIVAGGSYTVAACPACNDAEVSNFSVSSSEGIATIAWTTVVETNVTLYAIDRKLHDGTTWTLGVQVDFPTGAGQAHSIQDTMPTGDNYDYRLRCVFEDSSTEILAVGQTEIVQYDAATTAFMNAIGIADDATVFYSSTAYEVTGHQLWIYIDQLVVGLKMAGVWDLRTAIYPMIGGTAFRHSLNLKDPLLYPLTFSGTWTHGATGAKPNGVNAYADTGINAQTVLSQNDLSIGFYSGTNVDELSVDMGCNDNAKNITIVSRFSNQITPIINSTIGTLYSVTDSTGNFDVSRSVNDVSVYRNGVALGTYSTPSTGEVNLNIYLGARNDIGSPAFFSTREHRYTKIGAALTSAQIFVEHTIIWILQNNLGRE